MPRRPGAREKKKRGKKKVSGCVWPRTRWHLLMDLDACMRMLHHQLSDLCPQWQIVTPGSSVIARVLHQSQTHAEAKRGRAVWAPLQRNTRKEDKSSKKWHYCVIHVIAYPSRACCKCTRPGMLNDSFWIDLQPAAVALWFHQGKRKRSWLVGGHNAMNIWDRWMQKKLLILVVVKGYKHKLTGKGCKLDLLQTI